MTCDSDVEKLQRCNRELSILNGVAAAFSGLVKGGQV